MKRNELLCKFENMFFMVFEFVFGIDILVESDVFDVEFFVEIGN